MCLLVTTKTIQQKPVFQDDDDCLKPFVFSPYARENCSRHNGSTSICTSRGSTNLSRMESLEPLCTAQAQIWQNCWVLILPPTPHLLAFNLQLHTPASLTPKHELALAQGLVWITTKYFRKLKLVLLSWCSLNLTTNYKT